jgi:tRNA(fMet)-specific endonuclease VapC
VTCYLLDTNIISDLIRNPRGRAAKRIAKVGEDSVCTSIVVAAELRYGCAKSGSAKRPVPAAGHAARARAPAATGH